MCIQEEIHPTSKLDLRVYWLDDIPTVPLDETSKPARASQPTIVAISLINELTSRAFVLWDRSWESFARTQGCFETWALGGSDTIADVYNVVRHNVYALR
jgi:hypothetical protein